LRGSGPLVTLLLRDVEAVVLIRDDDKIIRTERIDLDIPEFAGGDVILKENIQICVCETLVIC